ncbi:MAG: hypothetical protein SVY53_06475 [Chloroflexota bacterium]|nr:hypothetical protein [Chloroflexota bacterium]
MIVIITASIMLFSVQNVAMAGLGVDKVIVLSEVAPGGSETINMTVRSESSDPPMDIWIDVMGLDQSQDGSYSEIEEDTHNDFSAASFVSVSPDEFHLEPGDSMRVEVKIDIPEDVGNGARYAVIHTECDLKDQVGVGTVPAIGTTLAVTLSGTEIVEQGRITKFDINENSENNYDITGVVENIGNYHYKAQAKLILKDESGMELDTISTDVTSSSIIPTCSRRFDLLLPISEELPYGNYLIDMQMLHKNGTLLDSRTETIKIGNTSMTSDIDENSIVFWTILALAILCGCLVGGILMYLVISRRRARNLG